MKILVANNNVLFTKELKAQVSFLSKGARVYEASNYSAALSTIQKDGPFNLMLLDLSLDGMDWRNGMNNFADALDGTPIVVLSTPSRYENISEILQGMFAEKNNSSLIEMLDEKTGKIKMVSKHAQKDGKSILTPRQTEVLDYLGQGLSNKQIAYEMSVSEATVKLHINALLRTLKVTNRTQAVLTAQKMGLL
jgi:DNA-binding NarL/FixJ family response regulator